MARIPILRDPGQLQTGNLTLRTPELTAVTGQAIAKGLGDVASVAMDISEKAKRAQDVTNLTEASIAMQNAQFEFANFQASAEGQDESKWMDKWNEIQNNLKTRFGQMKLTPDARLQLQDRVTNWSTRGTIMVQADAIKQTGRRTAQAFDNALTVAKQKGDFSIADQAYSDIEKLPLPQVEKDKFKIALDITKSEVAEKREYDDLLSMAKPGPTSDPKMAAELAWQKADAGVISKLQASTIAEEAKQTEAVNRRDAIMFYKQKMETGKPVTADEMMADYRLTDMDRDSLAMMQDGTRNDPAEFEKALTTVMDFDRSRFADDKQAVTALANLEANLEARFDGAYLSTLKKELDKRSTGISPEEAANDIGPALTMLEQEIERGGLGPVEKPVLKDGKPVMRDPKDVGFVETDGWFSKRKTVKENAGEPVPLMEPDKIAREAAAAVQREIRKTLESEVKAGKLKDQGAISARAIELFKAKGGKIAPVEEPASGLLPGIEQPRVDLNQILLRNGY